MGERLKKVFKVLSVKPFWNDTRKSCHIKGMVSIVFAVVAFILMFADIHSGSLSMALSSVFLVAGFSASAVAACVFKKPRLSAAIIAVIAAIILTSYAIGGGNEGFAILWIVVVPMFAISVLDMGVGILISVYFLILIPVLFYTPLRYLVEDKYTPSFLVRFPALYACIFVIAVIISIEKEYYNRKVNMSLHLDDLTGVYTRKFFFRKAEEMLQANPDTPFDVRISDIVDFKKINEQYGVDTGDRILVWIATYLKENMNENIIIGRYGGDQFVIMAPHKYMQMSTEEESYQHFQKSVKAAKLPKFNIKFGAYENIPHNKSVVSSCDKAHLALESIKDHYGIDLAMYSSEIEEQIEVQRKIENSMHQGLEEEQFKVYYQPKHDAKTGALIGAEALIRWIHPEFGFISPGDFIPLFEKNGFVVETDYYVWKRTCNNIKRWQDMGLMSFPVSVNVSKLVFDKNSYLKKAQTAVHEAGISENNLHVEITETMMCDDIDSLVRKLDELRAAGFQIELDDFGSGYTSMNILSSLPIDVVKLDMSFMRQFGDEKRTKVLVACINLAKELGYKTVSEGVEQKEQVDKLSQLGVDSIQGYYYSKPLPEQEFEEYIRKCMA